MKRIVPMSEAHINNLINERDALLVRISGISNKILAAQCAEEFRDLERQIEKAINAKEAANEKKFIDEVKQSLNEYVDQQFEKYDWLPFNAENFAAHILKPEHRKLCDDARVLMPRSLVDRRVLVLLATFLKICFEFINPYSDLLDVINSSANNVIIVIVGFRGSSRQFNLANKENIKLGIWRTPESIAADETTEWGAVEADIEMYDL